MKNIVTNLSIYHATTEQGSKGNRAPAVLEASQCTVLLIYQYTEMTNKQIWWFLPHDFIWEKKKKNGIRNNGAPCSLPSGDHSGYFSTVFFFPIFVHFKVPFLKVAVVKLIQAPASGCVTLDGQQRVLQAFKWCLSKGGGTFGH